MPDNFVSHLLALLATHQWLFWIGLIVVGLVSLSGLIGIARFHRRYRCGGMFKLLLTVGQLDLYPVDYKKRATVRVRATTTTISSPEDADGMAEVDDEDKEEREPKGGTPAP